MKNKDHKYKHPTLQPGNADHRQLLTARWVACSFLEVGPGWGQDPPLPLPWRQLLCGAGWGAPGGDRGTGGLPPSTWPRPQLCRFPTSPRVSRGSQDKPGGGGHGDPDLQKPRPREGTSQLGLPGNGGAPWAPREGPGPPGQAGWLR